MLWHCGGSLFQSLHQLTLLSSSLHSVVSANLFLLIHGSRSLSFFFVPLLLGQSAAEFFLPRIETILESSSDWCSHHQEASKEQGCCVSHPQRNCWPTVGCCSSVLETWCYQPSCEPGGQPVLKDSSEEGSGLSHPGSFCEANSCLACVLCSKNQTSTEGNSIFNRVTICSLCNIKDLHCVISLAID